MKAAVVIIRRKRQCPRLSQEGGTQSLERQHVERKRVCIHTRQIERLGEGISHVVF
jgi:hypothetical protein